MKKIIYFLIAIVFIVSSCDKEEQQFTKYDLGTEFLVSDGGITNLDESVTVSINNISKNLSSVKVYLGDNSIGDISLSDGTGSLVISATTLGISDIEEDTTLSFESTFDSKSIVRYHTVAITDPISVTAPEVVHKDTTFHFIYKIEPVSATVTSVTVEQKLFYNGTYNTVNPVNGNNALEDSIAFSALDYNIGDTIYVKVTASTANKSTSTETKFVVAPYSYENTDVFMLDTTANLAYNLDSAEYVYTVNAGDTADIEFTAAYPVGGGPVQVGFVSNNNAEFVAATSDDYDYADSAYISSINFASAVKVVSDAQAGDVFIYRTRRGTDAWSYGILKVIEVNKPQGVLEDSSIKFEYKH